MIIIQTLLSIHEETVTNKERVEGVQRKTKIVQGTISQWIIIVQERLEVATRYIQREELEPELISH